MFRLLVILALVILSRVSTGQILEDKSTQNVFQRSIVCYHNDQQDFDRIREITLNYRSQCAKLTSRKSPVIIFNNIYCLNSYVEDEAWIQYHLFDRKIYPVIEMDSMAYTERYFHMMDPVLPVAYPMITEFGIDIPDIYADRLDSRISTGLRYYMYNYPHTYTDYYFPISLSFFYNILK